jgi:hypothetical protein
MGSDLDKYPLCRSLPACPRGQDLSGPAAHNAATRAAWQAAAIHVPVMSAPGSCAGARSTSRPADTDREPVEQLVHKRNPRRHEVDRPRAEAPSAERARRRAVVRVAGSRFSPIKRLRYPTTVGMASEARRGRRRLDAGSVGTVVMSCILPPNSRPQLRDRPNLLGPKGRARTALARPAAALLGAALTMSNTSRVVCKSGRGRPWRERGGNRDMNPLLMQRDSPNVALAFDRTDGPMIESACQESTRP